MSLAPDRRTRAARRAAGLAAVAGVLLAPALSTAAASAQGHPMGTACPARAALTLPAPHWAPARSVLAPAGAVAVRLCRYAGLNAHPRLALTRTRFVTNPGRVSMLAWNLDRLPPFGPGAIACPTDDGAQILALLSYPAGRRIAVSVGLGGCLTVTNGAVVRTAEGFGAPRAYGPQLVAELTALVR
jgi:hypothetical protein